MGAITFKCPNCGGELKFEPASGRYICEYCSSDFSQSELDQMYPDAGAPKEETASDIHAQSPDAAQENSQAQSGSGEAVVYSCPSCGAQIVTDETTAATFCYYCHNPVILEGRLSGSYLPDSIIPFEIDRKKAEDIFLSYVRKKKFLPKAFFDKSQIEKLSGVYYPYWVYDTEVSGALRADGRRIRTWRAGDEEYTETKIYQITRSADISIKDQTMHALSKTDRDLVVNVQPYDIRMRKPFTMGYLSGFFAEKRDLEKSYFEERTRKETEGYARQLLADTVHGYIGVNIQQMQLRPESENWSYVLLPVWVLTYRTLGNLYYFALNGQTGALYGKLPVDMKKISLLGVIAGVIVCALCLWGMY